MSRTKIQVTKAHTFTGHKDSIYALEKETESTFFTSGSDGLVVRWGVENPDQGELIAQVKNTVYAMCLIPERNWLIVGQNYDGIHVIDLKTKKEISSLQLENHPFFDIKYLDGKLFIGSGSGKLFVIDVLSLNIISEKQWSEQAIRCLAISPENGHLAMGFSDNFFRVADLKTGNLLHENEGHTISVFSAAYTPNQAFLLTGSRDAHLKIWKTNEEYALHESIVAHMYTINDIAFRNDGKYFATCSKDKSVKVWDGQTFQLLKVIDKARHAGHGTSVNKLAWLGEDQIVSVSDDRSVAIWKLMHQDTSPNTPQ